MDLSNEATYYAYDIYEDMVEFINSYFDITGIKGAAKVHNVIKSAPSESVDIALILKTLPVLEQVEKNSGLELIKAIHAKYIIISFPAKSLTGRSKGMIENYGERFKRYGI